MKYILLFSLTFSYLFCAPAYFKTREFKQADGSSFIAKARGDEHLNWIETDDGEILKYNSQTKNFEYAQIKNNQLKASGVRYYKKNSKPARSLRDVKKLDKDSVYKLWKKRRESK
ncbi:MAG: hypothetical protein U9O83_04460 [Campylobacterota bacterium]|nr:hypothetical protein [Campylobacterota bacterium]